MTNLPLIEDSPEMAAEAAVRPEADRPGCGQLRTAGGERLPLKALTVALEQACASLGAVVAEVGTGAVSEESVDALLQAIEEVRRRRPTGASSTLRRTGRRFWE